MERKEKIIPFPENYKETGNIFSFKKDLSVNMKENLLSKDTINILKEIFKNITFSGKLLFYDKESKNIAEIDETILYDYEITVSKNMFIIKGKNEKGLIHGFISLFQLITETENEDFYISCCEIKDKPYIENRMIHICVLPETTYTELKSNIRISGMLKYSHIVIEFWGTYKFDRLKELSWEKSFTRKDIEPLIKDANALGMEVIPMFNHLGHASLCRFSSGKHTVLDNNPKLSYLFEPGGWTWCISKEKVRNLLADVTDELISLCGMGSYFHFGCDEATSFAYCDICSKYDGTKLFIDYINYLSKKAKEYNRRGIIWGDMLLNPQCLNEGIDIKGNISKIDHDLIIADWDYDIKEGIAKTSEFFNNKGFDTLSCPFEDCKNIEAMTRTCNFLNLFGMMATTWHSKLIYIYTRPAEYMWCNPDTITRKFDSYGNLYGSLKRMVNPQKGNYEESGMLKYQI